MTRRQTAWGKYRARQATWTERHKLSVARIRMTEVSVSERKLDRELLRRVKIAYQYLRRRSWRST